MLLKARKRMIQKSFTPTERAILDILSDGQPHAKDELIACLPDDLGDFGNVQNHLTNIRKKIRPREDIIAQLVQRRVYYRHIRVLISTSD